MIRQLAPVHCSFCAKRPHEVRKLIAGPNVYICDGCTALCARIVAADASPPKTAQSERLK